jgi:hypothetical protein
VNVEGEAIRDEPRIKASQTCERPIENLVRNIVGDRYVRVIRLIQVAI